MNELLAEFAAETRDTFDRIADALLAWEDRPTDLSSIAEIFRFVHTVKGSCGFLDLPRIAALAHAAETVLAEIRDRKRIPDAPLVRALVGVIDRIVALAATEESMPAVDSGDDAALIAALDAPVAATSSISSNDPSATRSIRVSVALLETLMTEVSDLVLVRNEIARLARLSGDDTLERAVERLTGAVGTLRDTVTRTRLQPVARLFASLPRLVRDTAAAVGKAVSVVVDGQDVEIDREMADAIRDPLLHIIRNAVDHGIETVEERAEKGKSSRGLISVTAQQSGNQVSIEVSDDGRGIDVERLAHRALERGMIHQSALDRMTPHDKAALIFEPGVSTAEHVTAISGRGVGMDVVRANVERLGGTVSLVNEPGCGLTVVLRAPLTLSIMTALVVTIADQRFAVPRGWIEEIVRIDAEKARLETVGGAPVAVIRGERVPVLDVQRTLGLTALQPALLLRLASPGGLRFVLPLDTVHDHEELVVRALAPQLASCGLFAGQSLDEAGHPIVVLDCAALANRIDAGGTRHTRQDDAVPEEHPKALFARCFDGRRIAFRSALVDRLVEIAAPSVIRTGGSTLVMIDGTLRRVRALGDLPSEGMLIAAIVSDGSRQVLVPVAAVEDFGPLADLLSTLR